MSNEIWQVMIEGQVYEADTETLKSWALDGYVQPTDKIKKGTLSWTEARHVPLLRGVFSGTTGALPSQPTQSTSAQSGSQYSPSTSGLGGGQYSSGTYASSGAYASAEQYASGSQPGYSAPGYGQVASQAALPVMAAVCLNHPQVEPKYLCQSCGSTWCAQCVKMVGNIAICKCGEMCRSYQELKQTTMKLVAKSGSIGPTDFVDALTYPLKDIGGLVMLTVVYCILNFGANFAGMASLLLLAMAFAIDFNCISRIIRNVSDGETQPKIVPEISDPWDDIFFPCVLGLGVMIISFGPMIISIIFTVQSAMALIFKGGDSLKGTLQGGLGLSLIAVVVSAVWGFFYYPMALLIAGYTHNLGSVLNPLVGLDTMRRLGSQYFVAFAFYLVTIAMQFGINILINIVIGQIGGSIINGAISFYFSLVVAYLLGLALFKRSDELGIA